MARKRVADVLVDKLVAADVKRVFTCINRCLLTDLLDSGGGARQESPDAIRKERRPGNTGVCLTVNAAVAW
jgi:hypothetical protein